MSGAGASFDPLRDRVEARTRRKSARELPRLLWSSVRLVHGAAPRLLLGTATLQVGAALVAAATVVTGERALRALLAADQDGRTASALPLLTLLAALAAATSVTTVLLAQRQRLLGELVQRAVWGRVLDVTSAVDLEQFEDPRFFDQLQRVETNAAGRPLAVTQGLVGIVGGSVGVLGLVAALLALEPVLVPLLLLAGVPLFLLNRRGGRLEFDFAVAQTPPTRERFYLRTVLTGKEEAKEVRAFGLAPVLRDRYDALYGAFLLALRRQVRQRTRLALAGTLAVALVSAATLALVLVLVDAGRLTLAEAGAAVLAVRLLGGRLEALVAGAARLFESALFLADLEAFLALARADPSPVGPPLPPFSVLRVEDLSFVYPGGDRPALEHVDLQLHAGQVVALVGENGSGKTTLAKLLAQLYRPTSGRVLWDGQDVAALPPDRLRRSVAVIFQDFVRYQLSARQNIALGRPGPVDEEALEDAARRAGAHELLAGLPEGYDTVLSKAFSGGRDLSGGQWQRVALARALYRDAPFVILDEPSAALDPRAEHRLFGDVRRLLQGRTVLFVSHRFSTVRNADLIVVLKQGRVVESGGHDELMAAQGLYAELFTLQAAAYLPQQETPQEQVSG